MASYPNSIFSQVNPTGTSTVDVVDHAAQHTNVNNEISAIENTLGTNSGTSVLKNFLVGNFAARTNNETFGTPAITGGTLIRPYIQSPFMGTQAISPAGGGTGTIDLSQGQYITVNMPAGNTTLTFINGTHPQAFITRIIEDATGTRVITWPSVAAGSVTWAGGATPVQSGANKVDCYGFLSTTGSAWDGCVIYQNR